MPGRARHGPLRKVTIGGGRPLHDKDARAVAASEPAELETGKQNDLIRKRGLPDGPARDAGSRKAVETDGRAERNNLRPVSSSRRRTPFGKEAVYA